MTRIAPQALSCDPVGVDEHSRLGVALCGLGGLGVAVVDRLNNRFHGRPQHIKASEIILRTAKEDADRTFRGVANTYVREEAVAGWAQPAAWPGL